MYPLSQDVSVNILLRLIFQVAMWNKKRICLFLQTDIFRALYNIILFFTHGK